MAVVSQFQCPKTSKLNTKGAADEAIDRCTTVDSLGASIDRDLNLLLELADSLQWGWDPYPLGCDLSNGILNLCDLRDEMV